MFLQNFCSVAERWAACRPRDHCSVGSRVWPVTIICGSLRIDRCHRKSPDDAARDFIALGQKLFAGHTLEPDKISEVMKADLEPTIFAIQRDRVTVSPEYGHMGNCR